MFTAQKLSAALAAASVMMALAFAGNRLVARGLAQRAEPTEDTGQTEEIRSVPATQPPATEPPTEETEPPEDQLLIQRMEDAASAMDAACVFVYDTATEKMLYSSTPEDQSLYPASITKLFTAWVALNHLQPDAVVTAGEELSLVQPGSSRAFISRGCSLTVEMLIEGMLVPSGNDAAYVLAAAAGRAIAGNEALSALRAVQTFVEEMNLEAERLGLENTHFVNPDGYHADDHYTCPADIARISALALEQSIIAKYVHLQQDQVTFASGQWITWYNTNGLLDPSWSYYIPTTLGMKTGYTQQAGYCLLGAFPGEAGAVLVGIFGGATKNGRYAYAATLLDILQGR